MYARSTETNESVQTGYVLEILSDGKKRRLNECQCAVCYLKDDL